MAQEKVMVCACLAGVRCVYDGSHKLRPELSAMHKRGEAILFCPEALGGLKAPHSPSEISGGDGHDVLAGRAKVVSREGGEVTEFFAAGARKALDIAKKHGIKKAIMKARSPSCGHGEIYDGTFSRTLRQGDGVTAALFEENGIEVVSDEEYAGASKDRSEKRGQRV